MAFQDYVLEQSEGNGVHFVMADGVRGLIASFPHGLGMRLGC